MFLLMCNLVVSIVACHYHFDVSARRLGSYLNTPNYMQKDIANHGKLHVVLM